MRIEAESFALALETAEVQIGGACQVLQVKLVAVSSVVCIKPGERVPIDAVVTKGNSAINQAPVTGESIPVELTLSSARSFKVYS